MYLFMKNPPFLNFVNHPRGRTREKTDSFCEGDLHQLSAILKRVKALYQLDFILLLCYNNQRIQNWRKSLCKPSRYLN